MGFIDFSLYSVFKSSLIFFCSLLWWKIRYNFLSSSSVCDASYFLPAFRVFSFSLVAVESCTKILPLGLTISTTWHPLSPCMCLGVVLCIFIKLPLIYAWFCALLCDLRKSQAVSQALIGLNHWTRSCHGASEGLDFNFVSEDLE